MPQWIYEFSTAETPALNSVGGKGLSLIRMTQRAMPVPPGFVLSVAFFTPWLEAILKTDAWSRALADTTATDFKERCDALKAQCTTLALDKEREKALAQALRTLSVPLVAVRSSSPEEDLEGASFAGGYETVLGVTEDRVPDALRRAFASCLDARVFLYKQEHGFDVTRPRIAVAVQQQLASEVSGVAFSLNPLNNDYDEAVINANFGLGESVVSGSVSPDTFVVDKVRRSILEQRIGSKESAIWLDEDGGTSARVPSNREQACLDEAQILNVSDLVARVEQAYDKPMDIEWAFAGGSLYLLQARPITGYFPFPQALRTAPGEQRQLYWDMSLAKWGMAEPLSPMGTDYIAIANKLMLSTTMNTDTPGVVAKVRPSSEGRVYLNISNSMKVQGKKRVAAEFRTMDSAGADILDALDEKPYLPDKVPPELRGMAFRVIGSMLGPIGAGLNALRNPEKYEQRYLETIEELRRNLATQDLSGLSLEQLAERTMQDMMYSLDVFIPIVFAAEIARMRIRRMFKKDPPEIRELVAGLDRALPHNVTIEMGLAMVRLACFPEIANCDSEEAFKAGLDEKTFATDFLQAWAQFMQQYGMRCPMEMDPATPRPSEHPEHLFKQLRALALHPEQDPRAIYEQGLAEREQAYRKLLDVARGRGKGRKFESNYRVLVALAGFREAPKYCMILAVNLFRRRALEIGQTLTNEGRLDEPAQIFDLYLKDVEHALTDASLDLRALATENTRYLRRYAHSREFPRIVDSRGRILQVPRKETREGGLAGEPISPGVVRGPAKVLHFPDEKPVLPGDILVTRATDPGWTPLFINAAGVVLEVGGMLQHGALVAREYGKPCVAGIERVTEQLEDGQMIEVDGSNGVVLIQET